MVDEEGREGLSRGHMGWAGRQSQMYLPLYTFWCSSSLCRLGFFIRRVLQHHLPVRAFPWGRVLLWILLSSSHCWRLPSSIFSCSLLCACHTTRRPPPHVCTVKGLCFGKARSSFILRQPITSSVSHETLFGISGRSPACRFEREIWWIVKRLRFP